MPESRTNSTTTMTKIRKYLVTVSKTSANSVFCFFINDLPYGLEAIASAVPITVIVVSAVKPLITQV